MKIFIAGGGRVGSHLAKLLSFEDHEITVLDSNPTRVEQIDFTLDVKTVVGNAASVLLLQAAEAGSADLFLSVTGSDEVNLIGAAAAKGLGAKQVVARVDDPTYVESAILYENVFGIEYLLSPEALTASEIVQYIEHPGVVATQSFGRGRIQMRQVRVAQPPTEGGRTLKDVCPPGCRVLVGVLSRNGVVTIPKGSAELQSGDLLTLIGEPEHLDAVHPQFRGAEFKPRKVFILGGGSIGLMLAQALETHSLSLKLFDTNMDRCNELASLLVKTRVVCRDATTRQALEQEHVGDADVFVTTTNDDERNIMAAVLAKELGATQTIAVVHQPDFAPLVWRLGIDHAVTPRACLANRVMKLVREAPVASLAVLEEGQVEILEFRVTEKSPLLGQRLKEVATKWPRGALVATILRGDEVIVPSGEDEVLAGDSVIVITLADSVEAVEKLF